MVTTALLDPSLTTAGTPDTASAPGSARRHGMGLVALGLMLLPLLLSPLPAAAGLLDTVKQNPALARTLCEQFKQLNASGQSATSKESIARVAASQGLSSLDAEVLTTYVIGLHCPDVR
jgi:hypothetical protein